MLRMHNEVCGLASWSFIVGAGRAAACNWLKDAVSMCKACEHRHREGAAQLFKDAFP